MSTAAHPHRPTAAANVAALFESQHGLASSAQLRAAGVPKALERLRIERGEWAEGPDRVIRLCGVPDDWRRPLMATSLASARVAITAGTALRLRDFDGFRDFVDVYAVARMEDRPRLPDDVRLWRSRRLTKDDVMVVDGIRVTTVATALVHAAGLHEHDLLLRAVDDALRRRLSPSWLQQTADRWAGSGVPGSGLLGSALADRCDRRLPRSWFERLARRVLAEQGVELEHELPVHDGSRRLAVLDLAEARYKVGVECQSWEWHASPAARRADARRKRRLRRLGWEIVELWWSDLPNPREVLADITDAIERQKRLLGPSTSV